MSSDPNNQAQYPPPQWENHPQRGAYPIAQQALNYRQPPPPQSSQPYPNPPGSAQQPPPPGDMVTLPPPQHQQQDFYHRPGPYDMYGGHPQDPMRGPPPPHMYQNQPAPRQRTAIACRYCRRRKIRCSGFEASEDGRCTNCQRFQQECIFTPVSSQAQAFVPAHTAYPHLRNAGPMPPQRGGRALYPQPGQTPIYGAHGQPLGTLPPQDPYQHQQPPPGYPPPGPYQAQPYDDRGPPQPPHPHDKVSRKRPRTDDSHPAVPPPHPPHTPSSHPDQGRPPPSSGRRGSGGTGGYEYPDPTPLVPVSPSSSTTSYASAPYHQPPPPQQPYYGAQPAQTARRTSPGNSAYSYGEARTSGSPHGSTSSSSAPGYGYPGGLHPPQVLPDRTGRTPPPPQRDASNNGNGQRGGMAVRDLLGPNSGDQGGRSSADEGMLKALNKRGM